MNKIRVSAPGKLMLLGEHAVFYSHPCIVTAVDQRMRATVEVINEPIFELQAPDVNISDYKKPIGEVGKGEIPKGAEFVETAVKNTLGLSPRHSGERQRLQNLFRSRQDPERFWTRSPTPCSGSLARMTMGISILTKSEFSPKLGFGSSSAVTVCIVKALSELLNLNLTDKEIFDLSYETVLDIQKKGSGFDVAAAVYGGTLYFLVGGKVIEPLDIKSLPLVVGYSGIKANTVRVINKVKKDFANRQDRLKDIYNGIEDLVNQGKEVLIKKDWKRFGDLMNKDQKYLSELGVSSVKLDAMIKTALDAEAYGAKLSGAGGGDCMIALHSVQGKLIVQKAIQEAGGEIISVRIGAEGVRLE